MSGGTPGAARDALVGVAGLGLLGSGIVACLLGHRIRVVGYNRTPARIATADVHIEGALRELVAHGMGDPALAAEWRMLYRTTTAIADLKECDIVIESTTEDLAAKRLVFDELEEALRPDAVIASNTSSIPITFLQAGRRRPERFIGMHWGEPCHVLRYLEIIRGDRTSDAATALVRELARRLGKDAVIVRKDIRGFISNRLMYAMMREAFHLLESGVGSIEDIDRSFRNDIGSWATVAGPFRFMDLTGIAAYARVMEGLLPELSNAAAVPPAIKALVARGADGVGKGDGFYRYTPEEAAHWDKVWREFAWDIRALADKHVPVGSA